MRVLLVLPLQTLLYVGLLWAMRIRHRTSRLTALVMMNDSAFGLIVAVTGTSIGLITDDGVIVIAIAVAVSFAFSAVLNGRGIQLAERWANRMPAQDPATLELLRASGFSGTVAAVAQTPRDGEELEEKGADAVFHLYGSAGTALADQTIEALDR